MITFRVQQSDYGRARHLVQTGFDTFLSNWTGIHPLLSSARWGLLEKLQPYVEAEELLSLAYDPTRSFSVAEFDRMLASWKGRRPARQDNVSNSWDRMVQSRTLYLERLMSVVSSNDALRDMHSIDVDQMRTRIQSELRGYLQSLASAAISQGNSYVADKTLGLALQIPSSPQHDLESRELQLQCTLVEARTSLLASEQKQRQSGFNILLDRIGRAESSDVRLAFLLFWLLMLVFLSIPAYFSCSPRS